MTEAFTLLLETTLGGRIVKGAGAMRIADGLAEINGRTVETRRVSLELLVALAPVSAGETAEPLLIEGRV